MTRPLHIRRAKSQKFGTLKSAILQRLEARALLSSTAIPTDLEVYEVDLINRERANPTGAVTALASNPNWGGATPDLNEGLSPGTISSTPKQPLAINTILTYTSESHSQWMITNNQFSHYENGVDPFMRMNNAGYFFSTAGENIASEGTTGTLNNVSATIDEQNLLFIDHTASDRGHRVNLMDNDFNEVGAGIATGVVNGYNTLDLTQDFGNTGAGSFLTGITYNDTSGDGFFEPGEEVGGVTITATRTSDNAVFTTTSWSSGGYSLPLAAGTYKVVASGGAIGSPAAQMVTINGANVESYFLETAGASPVALLGLNNYLKLDADGSTVDVYNGTSATGTPKQYPLSQVSSFTLAPTIAGTGLVTVDESAGNPIPTGGLTVNGSATGVSLSLKIDGTIGDDLDSVNATTVSLSPGGVITYAGLTRLTFDTSTGNDQLTQNAQPGNGATLTWLNTTSTDALTVNGSSTYTFPASTSGIAVDTLNSITISAGSTVTIPNPATHANRTLLVLGSSSIGAGTLNLAGNDLDLQASGSLSSATSLIASGFNSGTWSGAGIRSSAAASDTNHLTGRDPEQCQRHASVQRVPPIRRRHTRHKRCTDQIHLLRRCQSRRQGRRLRLFFNR